MKKRNTYKDEYDDGFFVYTDGVEDLPDYVPESTLKNDVFEWLDVVVTALIAVVIIFSFVFRVATIEGDSMLDTLHSGEKVIISGFNYTAKAGDIVVISRNADNSVEGSITGQKPIIKRVIATENQTVDIDDETGAVYVDGKKLNETYLSVTETHSREGEVEFPVIVPEGCVFVLGDNRAVSLDSRFLRIGDCGMVDTRYILGEAVFRIFPFNKIGKLGE